MGWAGVECVTRPASRRCRRRVFSLRRLSHSAASLLISASNCSVLFIRESPTARQSSWAVCSPPPPAVLVGQYARSIQLPSLYMTHAVTVKTHSHPRSARPPRGRGPPLQYLRPSWGFRGRGFQAAGQPAKGAASARPGGVTPGRALRIRIGLGAGFALTTH
jgi:hypothetical protein